MQAWQHCVEQVRLSRRWPMWHTANMQFDTATGPLTVNIPDLTALCDAVEARLAAGEGFAIATLNLDHLVKLRRDAGFSRAYLAQDFVTADGNPVVWCCRRAGQDVALVPGSDAIVPLARVAARLGRKIALVGSTQDALEAAAEGLQAQVSGVEVSHIIAPKMGFDPDGSNAREILATLQADKVGLCFLALGAPKQERLAALGRQISPGVGFASIGAGLDFIAGRQTRAPRWVRRFALEWLWRMLGNPRRLVGRYLRSALILPGLWLSAGRQRPR